MYYLCSCLMIEILICIMCLSQFCQFELNFMLPHFDLQLHVSISQLRECSEILVPYVRHLSKLSIWFGCDHRYWPSHSNLKYFNMLLCTVGSFSLCPKFELFQSLFKILIVTHCQFSGTPVTAILK